MSSDMIRQSQTMEGTQTAERSGAGDEWSLIDWYLEQQNQMSAVERFSQVHAELKAPVYRELLPAKAPGPGEQYAFEVNLDKCSGCKACVTACHSLNGLDDQEAWREVGLLTGGTEQHPYMQHVTSACHHCLEPACMEVCPTLSYEKDETTGIVKHLDDQCFRNLTAQDLYEGCREYGSNVASVKRLVEGSCIAMKSCPTATVGVTNAFASIEPRCDSTTIESRD